MKIRRYRKVNKHMNFYLNNFNFRKPYQLLIDGTFCYAALKNQVNIADNIPRYLHSELKLLTTQCVIIETENLGSKLTGALIILKQYTIHKCGHEGKPITGSACLLSMLNKKNDKHYIIATQDRDLQEKIRKVPASPLLYLVQKTPILDPPSEASLKASSSKFDEAFNQEKELVKHLKQQNGIVEEDKFKFKKKKKKGPNPLSCKKKKNKPQQPISKAKETTKELEKKRRKKIRVAKHVKEALKRGI